MAKTPAEIELDHFWRGTGRYLDYGTSDESSEAATRIFLRENIVIPRIDLPEISEEHGGVNAPAEYHLQIKASRASGRISAYGQRLVALLELARSEYREAQNDAEKEALASLMRRRDELASEFTAVNSYSGQLPYTQNLINRIIELEGATK